jgi:thioredoxin-related protein
MKILNLNYQKQIYKFFSMRKLTLLLCILSLPAGAVLAQRPLPEPAQVVLKEACRTARKENKNVFIIFHASWCGWCRRMDSLMSSPSCKELFNSQYTIRRLDVLEAPGKENLENPGAEALLKKYHGDRQGIPYWLILDKNGKLLADSRIKPENANPDSTYNNSGCPATAEEVAYFTRVLGNTSQLDATQLSTISRSFLKD